MKNFKTIVFCFLIAMFTSSCSSTQQAAFYNSLSKSTVYLKSSSSYITQVVLSQETSIEKRAKAAQVIYDVSYVIENLTVADDISMEGFSSIISKYIPSSSIWNEFAMNIILLYGDFYAQSAQLEESSRKKILISALNRISSGCKSASSKYL